MAASVPEWQVAAVVSTVLFSVVIEAEAAGCADILRDRAQARSEQAAAVPPSGAIQIEVSGRAAISVERGTDGILLRTILESLCR